MRKGIFIIYITLNIGLNFIYSAPISEYIPIGILTELPYEH